MFLDKKYLDTSGVDVSGGSGMQRMNISGVGSDRRMSDAVSRPVATATRKSLLHCEYVQ